jgi:hypothetical protein
MSAQMDTLPSKNLVPAHFTSSPEAVAHLLPLHKPSVRPINWSLFPEMCPNGDDVGLVKLSSWLPLKSRNQSNRLSYSVITSLVLMLTGVMLYAQAAGIISVTAPSSTTPSALFNLSGQEDTPLTTTLVLDMSTGSSQEQNKSQEHFRGMVLSKVPSTTLWAYPTDVILPAVEPVQKYAVSPLSKFKNPKEDALESPKKKMGFFTKLSQPLKNFFQISSHFGMRHGRPHRGIDFAARTGTPVYAAGPGLVVQSGWESGYGKAVIIQHPNGLKTRYAHCHRLIARQGEIVEANQQIGTVGNTGNSTGPHLHFEVIEHGVAKNPVLHLESNPT